MMSAGEVNDLQRLVDANEFLTLLFGDLPDGALILIWTVDGDAKVSRFFGDPAEAAQFAVDRRSANCYVGVGWQTEDHGAHARGKAEDVGGIVGLWADIDIAGPGHSAGKTYPPTREAALALIARLPLHPTLVVWSGGGFHCWWLFHEPLEFEGEDDRARGAALARGWGGYIKQRAADAGYDVDGVFDLTRVLRIPGTYRTKPGDPERRYVESYNRDVGGRFNLGDFEPYLVATEPGGRVEYSGSELVLDLTANPPFDKFIALCEVEPRFKQSWERKRKDLKDQSQSGYDQSLANFAALAEWIDQEIANLIAAARRRSGDRPEKALRLDYIQGLIARARAAVESIAYKEQVAHERAAEERKREDAVRALEAVAARPVEPKDDGRRVEVLKNLSEVFGTQVAGVLQHGRFKAIYSLILPDFREVFLGAVETLLDPNKTRARIYEAIGHTVPMYKREQWLRVARAIGQVVDVVETPESGRNGELADWLQTYVGQSARFTDENWSGALANGDPFVRRECVGIHASSFQRFLKLQFMQNLEIQEIRDRLRAAGFRAQPVNGRPGKGASPVCKTYWIGPRELAESPCNTESPYGNEIGDDE